MSCVWVNALVSALAALAKAARIATAAAAATAAVSAIFRMLGSVDIGFLPLWFVWVCGPSVAAGPRPRGATKVTHQAESGPLRATARCSRRELGGVGQD